MTATVGPLIFDAHVGSIVPARAEIRVDQRADGTVRTYPTGKLRDPTGQVTTTKLLPTEFDALNLAGAAARLVDGTTTVTLSGVVLPGVRVDDVDAQVRHVAHGAQTGWKVTCRWSFGPGPGRTGEDITDHYVTCKIDTASVWTAWEEQTGLACVATTEGYGTALGSAVLVQELDPEDATSAPKDIAGLYVRIRLPAAGEDLSDPKVFEPAWWGKVQARRIGTDQGITTVVYDCVDLLVVLQQIMLYRWYERANDGTICDPGERLPINARIGGDRANTGDRHTLAGVVVDSHERNFSPANRWTTEDFAKLLLAAVADQAPGGPTWSLGGQTTVLDHHQPIVHDGMTVMEVLASIMAGGVGFRVVMVAGNPVLRLSTSAESAIVASSFTIPANDQQITVDLTGEDIIGYSLDEDHSMVLDDLRLELARPWQAITLGANATGNLQMDQGWSSSDRTAWDAAEEDARRTEPLLQAVGRRFELKKTWLGQSHQVPADRLEVDRVVAGTPGTPDALHGAGGETGVLQASGGVFPWAAIRFTKALPYTEGAAWDDASAPDLDENQPLAKPFVIRYDGSTYTYLDMEVTIDDETPAVVVGRDHEDAATLLGYLDAGDDLIITVGFRYPVPWRVGWKRVPAQRPVDQSRVGVYQRPDIEYRYLRDQTVVGIDGGALVVADEKPIGDQPDDPDELLALLRLWHEPPQRSLTYSQANTLDMADERPPGKLITQATLPYGDPDAGTAAAVGAVIVSRARNFDKLALSVTIQAQYLRPDIGPLFTPESVPFKSLHALAEYQ